MGTNVHGISLQAIMLSRLAFLVCKLEYVLVLMSVLFPSW